MSKITIDISVIEQALEALEESYQYDLKDSAIDALRAALAEPVQEPVLTVDALRVEFERQYRGKLGITRVDGGAYLSPAIEAEWKQFVRRHTQRPAEPVLNPAPGYCKHCKQYTIEEPLPAEPVQEPVESALQAVAEKIGDQCAVWYGIGARDVEEVLREAARYGLVHGALAQPQEPVAWRWRLRSPTDAPGFAQPWNVTTYYPREQANEIEPLYTAPPQRKPLTDDRVWLEYMQLWPFRPNDEPTLAKDILRFARAIERAHGIKE